MKTNRLSLLLVLTSAWLVGVTGSRAAVTFVANVNANFYAGSGNTYHLDFDNTGTWELYFLDTGGNSRTQFGSPTVQVVGEPIFGGGSYSLRLGYGMTVSSVGASFGQWVNGVPVNASAILGVFDPNIIGEPPVTQGYWQDFDDPDWFTVSGYLGARFQKADGWHYGWVELEVFPSAGGFVRSYAWETTPDTPILTGWTTGVPEPSRAVLCGVGGLLALLRRRR